MQPNETFQIIQQILTSNEKDTTHVVLTPQKSHFSIHFFNILCLKLSFGKVNYIYMKSDFKRYFSNSNSFQEMKSLSKWIRIPLSNKNDLIDLAPIIIEIYDSVTGSDPFGCCSSYLECSDAKECIRIDLRAKACIYRKNLESGKIFYGKNSTI